MKYSQKQIRYILKSGGRNINNAIIKDGQVFINDITLAPALRSDNVVFTYRGTPINLSLDTENRRRAVNILYRAYSINGRRNRIREFFQNLSDKLTANYKLDQMSDLEIRAWFALDKIIHNTDKIRITRVGYMYKIHLGDVIFSHIPAEDKDRTFIMMFNGHDILGISHKTVNQHLYNRASDVFFRIYSEIIAPTLRGSTQKNQASR